jgi:hypothetical protein
MAAHSCSSCINHYLQLRFHLYGSTSKDFYGSPPYVLLIECLLYQALLMLSLAISNLKINYVPVTPPGLPTSPYAGPPSDLVEQSWHELLKNINLRVTGSELQQSDQTSIPLPEGGGYMAWIGAHHQLHCIVSLHSLTVASNEC